MRPCRRRRTTAFDGWSPQLVAEKIDGQPWPTELPAEVVRVLPGLRASMAREEARLWFDPDRAAYTTSNAPAQTLMLDSLKQSIKNLPPRMEIQIGKGQMESFRLAAMCTFAISQIPLPDHRSDRIDSIVWNDSTLYGIPIMEHEIYPAGVGCLVRFFRFDGREIPQPDMLLDWQTGALQCITFPRQDPNGDLGRWLVLWREHYRHL